MMLQIKKMIPLLPVLALLLAGCGSKSSPAGPGGSGSVVPFDVTLQPPEITPPQNAQVKLFPTFPEQFAQLQGQRAYFSSSSGQGFFTNDSSFIAPNNPDQSNLSPGVWYAYNGSSHDLVDTVKVEVVDLYGHTLAWNYGTILVH